MEILSKEIAIKRKLNFYFTGKPCKHGHVAERYISGHCRECQKIKSYNSAKTHKITPTNIRVFYSGQLLSKEVSFNEGLKRYFTGKPCQRGHIAQRYTNIGSCVICADLATKSFAKNNRAKMREYSKRCKIKNPNLVEKHRIRERNRHRTNPEFFNKKRREARKNNPELAKRNRDRSNRYYSENKDILGVKNKAYRSKPENREKAKNKTREWYRLNKKRAHEVCKLWHKNNPGKSKIMRRGANHRRRARLTGAGGVFTKNDIFRIYKLQKEKCAECKKSIKKKYEIDHIMPIFLSGSNWPSNLQLLCRKCNRSKWAKDPIVWARENGRLL